MIKCYDQDNRLHITYSINYTRNVFLVLSNTIHMTLNLKSRFFLSRKWNGQCTTFEKGDCGDSTSTSGGNQQLLDDERSPRLHHLRCTLCQCKNFTYTLLISLFRFAKLCLLCIRKGNLAKVRYSLLSLYEGTWWPHAKRRDQYDVM